MSWGNSSMWMEFVFLAYPSQSELDVLSFLGISLVYTRVITGNVLIMVAIQTEACLHTPIYYLLGSLSGVEIGYTAVVVPTSLPTSYGRRRPPPCWAVPLRWASSWEGAEPPASSWLPCL